MNTRRDIRGNRAALFDGMEEGGIRASSSYSSHEIDEHDNERAMEGLQDRVILLKRLSGDINEEVDNHNRMLDRMGNDMDSSRGVLSGTMDRFKTVLIDLSLIEFSSKYSIMLYHLFLFSWVLFSPQGFRDQIKPENVYASGIIRGCFSSHLLSHQVKSI
ncbi:bet1-like SNARE 1-1 isoform X1 [Cannabis sativa]|uniref:bet1-like SNARE 1-1 isoform X1 n=1 Tax=Cannabis sativa TaxID=3483 RepID=UPI0029C9E88A|nr:bet1-like SNARE 1-1 isoform X1 [Cannabis sativa]XP_060970732.1 bet1-like SNARE 1-1 isoform X1 [Cannabis sativa]